VRIGRRPLFFLILGAVCLALIPPTPAEFRWVNLSMGGLAVFWAVLLAIEEMSGINDAKRRSKAER
jgi:hypothetical protein